jgi:hypothetical protein
MNLKTLFYLLLVTGVLTYTLYTVRSSRAPDPEQIQRCNELVSDMPEDTRQEIDRSISRFLDCIGE